MGSYSDILILIITGIILIWFGFFLFFRRSSPLYPFLPWVKKEDPKASANNLQFCPVCAQKMLKGKLVKTIAFPSSPSGSDRLMYIRGCYNCLEEEKPRKCPVCKSDLSLEDFLVARMFERSGRKNHVHVLGCNHCRKT